MTEHTAADGRGTVLVVAPGLVVAVVGGGVPTPLAAMMGADTESGAQSEVQAPAPSPYVQYAPLSG
jgi:hypothetical protein